MIINKILIKTITYFLFFQIGNSTEEPEQSLDLPLMKLYVDEQGSSAHKEYEELRSAGVIGPVKQRPELFPTLKKECHTDTFLKGSRHISNDFLNVPLNCRFNESILNSYPLYYQEDKTPNARIGVFLWYLHDNGEAYLLFSQNPRSPENPHKSESYSDLGSSLQLKQDMPETFLEAAQRVIEQQTGHFYSFNQEMILQNSFIYFRHSTNERQISILFTQAPYSSPMQLKEALDKSESGGAAVKLNFLWINVKSILSTLPLVIKHLKDIHSQDKRCYLDSALKWENLETLDGQNVSLRIRAFILEVLKDEEAQKILHHLISRQESLY